MDKKLFWRVALTLGVVFLAVTAATPLEEKINLGLDLQGGMSLLYGVDTDKAVLDQVEALSAEIERALKGDNVRLIGSRRVGDSIALQYTNLEQADKGGELIARRYSTLDLVSRSGRSASYRFKDSERDRIALNSINQAVEILRNRIDQFGVAEPTLQKEGADRILIQLPGVKDRQRALGIIGKTAKLEFRMVDESTPAEQALIEGVPFGSEILYERVYDPTSKVQREPLAHLIKRKIELTGDKITNATVRVSQFNQPYVSIDFNGEGADIFEEITGANVGKRLAIVLDDSVYSTPVIRSRIAGGSAMIEGGFSFEEANDLALVLRAGALPAPLIQLEERAVGPSLGEDSIENGIRAMIVGSILLVVFMLFYYRGSGLIADLALVLNIVILAGALAYFGATLTLPGIAGIILTVGMAVDANVLIFERIKEEIKIGKTIKAAVEAGFQKAFVTIVDANITTLIAALVLFQFGSGPIKGFAVTLTIGTLASMFTAIFVSRTIFMWRLRKRRVESLSI